MKLPVVYITYVPADSLGIVARIPRDVQYNNSVCSNQIYTQTSSSERERGREGGGGGGKGVVKIMDIHLMTKIMDTHVC